MALTILSFKATYRDTYTDAELMNAIDTDLGTLTITHLYGLSIVHKNGFYHILVLYD